MARGRGRLRVASVVVSNRSSGMTIATGPGVKELFWPIARPYQPSTPVGDATRPTFIYDQLMSASLSYSPVSGIGSATTPFQGTLSAYMSQVVSTQSVAASAASNLQAGQSIVVNALQARFDSASGVSIDTEMANLLTLQNAYGANARVMGTVKAMLETLMQIM